MCFMWWAMTGSNCRHSACKADALPAELIAHIGDPCEIRTREPAVKGRCLNHLTNGPLAPEVGLEPTTDRLTADCSTTELFRKIGAENGARTRDPDLGKVVLYH